MWLIARLLQCISAVLPKTPPGKAWKTLDEIFVECDTRQKNLSEQYIDNTFFMEYFLSNTQQRFYRVSLGTRQRKVIVTVQVDDDGHCAECHGDARQKTHSLPNVY
jgi:hypothetical protein